MKKIVILFFLIPVLACFTGCEDWIAFDYWLPDEYDSVYCFIPERNKTWVNDTAICFSKEDLRLLSLTPCEDGDGNLGHGHIDFGLGTNSHLFKWEWQCDTVSFFIFDKDTVDSHPWDYIVKNYCVLQRYDFTKKDLDKIRDQIYYPPTEEMADIHMYPRYKKK
jgi:hypothetical protein